MLLKVINRVWIRKLQFALLLLTISTLVIIFFRHHLRRVTYPSKIMEFSIKQQWDGKPIDHPETYIHLASTEAGIKLSVDAPFFNDPQSPGTKSGEPFYGLWNYEVVEAFFLNDKSQYLEVELCPHGQHMVLMLNDYRKVIKQLLPLEFVVKINGKSWKGEAIIPWEYFPPNVNRFNAYAIHGSEPTRIYEALFPVPTGKFSEPDFHRLEFFGSVNLVDLWPTTGSGKSVDKESPFWK